MSGNGLNGMPSGLYKRQAEEHNNKPVYKYSGGVATDEDWCIFQVGLGLVGSYSCMWTLTEIIKNKAKAISAELLE